MPRLGWSVVWPFSPYCCWHLHHQLSEWEWCGVLCILTEETLFILFFLCVKHRICPDTVQRVRQYIGLDPSRRERQISGPQTDILSVGISAGQRKIWQGSRCWCFVSFDRIATTSIRSTTATPLTLWTATVSVVGCDSTCFSSSTALSSTAWAGTFSSIVTFRLWFVSFARQRFPYAVQQLSTATTSPCHRTIISRIAETCRSSTITSCSSFCPSDEFAVGRFHSCQRLFVASTAADDWTFRFHSRFHIVVGSSRSGSDVLGISRRSACRSSTSIENST